MEQAVGTFLNYGAMGVLALAFVTQLFLFVRSDKRAQRYAEQLDEARFDRGQLIQVVIDNTKAATALAAQITEQTRISEQAACVMQKLDRRLENGKCPLRAGEETPR